MIKYILRKVNNMNSNVHNKWFAYPVKRALKKSSYPIKMAIIPV